jgi:hypothetical protein
MAIPPDAVNPNFHAVNIITTRTNAAEANDDSWVPLVQVEHRLKSLELSQETAEQNPNAWQTVTHHKIFHPIVGESLTKLITMLSHT